jgi:hypothetical protein
MPTAEFLQLIVVAIVAGYIGYRLGQASAAAGRADAPSTPLPGPVADASEPQRERRSSAPPPAGAGDDAPGPTQQRTPPRRSSAPPPAAAGLMDRGGGSDA